MLRSRMTTVAELVRGGGTFVVVFFLFCFF